jgi:hypothetical protein
MDHLLTPQDSFSSPLTKNYFFIPQTNSNKGFIKKQNGFDFEDDRPFFHSLVLFFCFPSVLLVFDMISFSNRLALPFFLV